MAFKRGERVVVVRDELWPHFVGAVTQVTSDLYFCPRARFRSEDFIEAYVHEVDLLLPRGARCVYRPEDLELYRPDHNEKLSTADESLSSLLPRTIRDLCSAGDAERAKRKVGV